jgi:nucleoside-diphosphate-sugar epimerase
VRALVTGGAGFIGHHLVRALLAGGWTVAIIDDLSTGEVARLAPLADRIDFIQGDIRDPAAVDEAMASVDVVFHEAALPSVARSVADPRLTNDINTTGTIEVMLGAARAGVSRVVYASSSSIYGSTPELPRREIQRPDPQSPYAASKLAAEHYVHALGNLHGLETVALRYFNVFGPGQDPASEYAAVVPRFIVAGLNGESPHVHGDGHQTRDFTYIDNVVAANLLAATRTGVSGLTCNIGCGGQFSLLELLSRIEAALGVDLVPTFGLARPGDVPHSQADISLAVERLGYDPAVGFDDGIRQTVAWFRERHDVDSGQPSPREPSSQPA